MKRRLLVLMAVLAGMTLQAKPVDPTLLLRAAQHVLQRSDVVDATPTRFTECRLYIGADSVGFVLLSADDGVRPLLGYSLTGTFPTEGMPEQMAAWIDGYQREIASAIELGSGPSSRARDEWDELLDVRPFRKSVTAVGPLLRTKWDQTTGYNNQCPYDSVAGHCCYTGCVATAAAQVMKYWNHPEVGRGSHSYTHAKYGTLSACFDTTHYQWNRMPNTISMSTGQAQINAMARLIADVGIAVDMNYGSGSSGAYTNPLGNIHRASSETALKEYFRYNPSLFTAYKEGFSDAAWRAMIDADLDSARPVLYDGYGTAGGHAFVLDGRDTLGLYHFNWGWSGSGNGFFTLDSLAATATASFSQLNSAIFHIYPINIETPTISVFVESADPTRGTVRGSSVYSTDSMRIFLMATAKPGYRFDHWTSGNPANPIITSPTRNMTDTAVFVPIHRDSVGYCRNNGIAYKNLTDQDSVEWGIRIPYEYFAGKERLREVHFWTYETANNPYYLRLYRGSTPDESPCFYTDSLMAFGYGMNIYTIPDNLTIDFTDTTPLWVTIYSKGSPFPISYSHFTGTVDGSWVRYDSVWQPMYEALHVYGSWMLRALLDPSTHVAIPAVDETPIQVSVMDRTVTAMAADPISLYDVMGRLLATAREGMLRCTVPAAGVYVVRAGAGSKKIIVY